VPELKFPIRLELGCGDDKHRDKDYVGLDVIDYGQEIAWDMEEGIPLPDNSCAEVYCSHTLEHLEDLIGVMNEIWRVLMPHRILYLIVPHKDHEKAFVPSHINFFSEYSFDFFEYESYAVGYQSRIWKVLEKIVNDRKDLHVKMEPIK
jgi:ubiquinone/menaquinone biosynthesis C-methylase UbiE